MNISLNKMGLALAATGVITSLAACGGGSGSGPGTVVNSPALRISSQAAGVSLVFIDAISGKRVSEEVTVTLTGQPAGLLTTLPNSSGQVAALDSGSSASSRNATLSLLANFSIPGSFSVTPNAAKWIAQPVTVSRADAQAGTVQIPLLPRLKNDPNGAYAFSADDGMAVTVGGTTRINERLDASTTALGRAAISLAANTVINGAATGAVTVSVTKFGNPSDFSAWSGTFPGTTFSLANGENLASATAVRFNVTDSSGKLIKSFGTGSDKPVTLEMELPAGIGAGLSSYPVHYFDESSQTWVKETDGSVIDLGGGRYSVRFSTDHLSTWSLGYTGNRCLAGKLTLEGRPVNNTEALTVQIDSASPLFSKTLSPVTDSNLTLTFAPNFPVHIVVTKTSGGAELARTASPINLCTPGQKLTLGSMTAVPPATLQVTVTEHCKINIDVSRPGPTTVLFTPDNSSVATGGWTGEDGIIDISRAYNSANVEGDLGIGTSGTLQIRNRFKAGTADEWFTTPIQVNQNPKAVNMKFVELDCETPTGVTGSTGLY